MAGADLTSALLEERKLSGESLLNRAGPLAFQGLGLTASI